MRITGVQRCNWLCAAAIALAVILVPTVGARAALPNQGDIDSAIKELTDAEQQARDNIPGNSRVKDAEDALDAAKRANEDTPSDDPGKANAEAAETAAQAAADALREDLKGRTPDFQTERYKKYREALDKRRAARKKLKALLAELGVWFRNRRAPGGVGGTKEVEEQIIRLRPHVSRAEQPITPQSTAALTPFGAATVNIANDGQAYCTFGKADPTKVALAPADKDGNPLAAKMLASLPLMAPSGVGGPAKSDGPAPKADKPQGGGTPTPQTGAPAPQGPSTSKPPAEQAASAPPGPPPAGSAPAGANASGPSTVPPPENPTAYTGSDDLGKAAGLLLGVDVPPRGSPPPDIPPPLTPDAAPGGPTTATPGDSESALDELDETQVFGDGTMDEKFQKWMQEWIRARQAAGPFPTLGSGGLTPLEQFILYHQYLREAREQRQQEIKNRSNPKPSIGTAGVGLLPGLSGAGVTPKGPAEFGTPSPGASLEPVEINPEVTKPGWERSGAWPTPSGAGGSQPGSGKSTPVDKTKTDVKSPPPSKAALENPASLMTPAPAMSPAGETTIHFKATESVMTAGSHGPEVKAQIVKLIPTETAALPKTGRSKTEKAAVDQDHDSSPVTCVLDKSGRCKAQLASSQTKVYGLPANGPSNYVAEMDLRENTGGVFEHTGPSDSRTGGPTESMPSAPAGTHVIASTFHIGKQKFTRVAATGANAEAAAAALATYGQALGTKLETDHCGEKKPGPPLGMEPASLSGLTRELPQATIALSRSVRPGADKR